VLRCETVDNMLRAIARAGMPLKAVLACLLFMACSAAMMIVNKHVMIMFELPVTVVLIQVLFTVTVLLAGFSSSIHIGSCDDFVRWARFIPFLYSLMLTSSLLALNSYSMGAMTVVRNFAPIFTLPIEKVLQENIPADCITFLILLYVASGAVLYMKDDIHFSAFGLVMMLVNAIVASLERLMQRRLIAVRPVDISKTGMLFINNAAGLFYVSGVLLIFPEYQDWSTITERSLFAFFLLFLSCIVGVAIGWSAINAQAYVSASTMLVLTNLNKVIVIVYGMLLLGEARTPQAITGCLIALSGGLLYGQDRRRLLAKTTAEKNNQAGLS